ncbi:MAG: hypothetical protein WC188_03785 [Candidatus Caldatribacteriota bacterium]
MFSIVMSNDFYFEVARGNVDGFSALALTGVNAAVSDTEDVWNMGGAYTAGDAAAVIHVSSSSDADTTQTVTITGLDANYDEITESIALAGQTETSGVKLFLRVNSFTIDGVAAGDVYAYYDDDVTAGVPNTQAKIQAKIEIGALAATNMFYTVPRNKNMYLTSFRYRSTGSTTKNDVILTLSRTLFGGAATIVQTIKYTDLGTTNYIDDKVDFVDQPILLPAKSYFKMSASLAGGTALNLTVEAKFIVEDVEVTPTTTTLLNSAQHTAALVAAGTTLVSQNYWLIGLDSCPTQYPTSVNLDDVLTTITGATTYCVAADTEVAFDPAYYSSGKLVSTTKKAILTIMRCVDSAGTVRYVYAPVNTLVCLGNVKKIKYLA